MSSKPQTTSSSTVSNKTPLAGPQGDAFNDVWTQAGNTLQNNLNMPMPEHFVAGPTAAQTSGANQLLAAAPNTGGAAPQLADLAQKVAGGYFLNPANDPTFQGTVDAALRPITRNLTENVLPTIQDASLRSSGAGNGPAAYGSPTGGSPQDIMNERAVRDWGVTASDATSKLAGQSRAMGMSLIPQAPQLSAGATTAAITPGLITGQAGAQQQQWAQGGLQDIISKYMLNQQMPLTTQQSIANILSTGGFGTNSSNTQSIGPSPDPTTQWIQGLAGGASTLGSLFGAGAGGTSAASGIMGLAALSDRRMKEDIEQVGMLDNGLPVYSFRYKGGGSKHVGLMADEVAQIHPEAIIIRLDGMMAVNYVEAVR